MTEEDVVEYVDVLADFSFAIQKYGARRVLMDFQSFYPDLFQEVKTQINRFGDRPIAALLKK